MSVFVSAADMPERDGATSLLAQCADTLPRLKKIWADGGYTGAWANALAQRYGIEIEVVKRTDDLKRFVVVPRRWVVERTFAWFNRYKRLAKDYELRPEHSESMIYIAMSQLMLKRLRK